jgi:hypothetical protein
MTDIRRQRWRGTMVPADERNTRSGVLDRLFERTPDRFLAPATPEALQGERDAAYGASQTVRGGAVVASTAVDAIIDLHQHANERLVGHRDVEEAVRLIENTFQMGAARRLARYMERDQERGWTVS